MAEMMMEQHPAQMEGQEEGYEEEEMVRCDSFVGLYKSNNASAV